MSAPRVFRTDGTVEEIAIADTADRPCGPSARTLAVTVRVAAGRDDPGGCGAGFAIHLNVRADRALARPNGPARPHPSSEPSEARR